MMTGSPGPFSFVTDSDPGGFPEKSGGGSMTGGETGSVFASSLAVVLGLALAFGAAAAGFAGFGFGCDAATPAKATPARTIPSALAPRIAVRNQRDRGAVAPSPGRASRAAP